MGNLSISTSGSFRTKVSLDISSLTYSGSYSVNPGAFSQVLPVKDLFMSDDLTINAFPLASTTFTSNGTYFASDENVGGYSKVIVSIPFYNGSYEVIPSGTSQSLPTSGKLMQADVMVNAVPLYSGSYNITPSGTSQALPTSGKYLSSDIIVGSASGGGGNEFLLKLIERVDSSTSTGTVYELIDTNGDVSYIGDYLCYRMEFLSRAVFPSTRFVGRSAFGYCTSLTSIEFPICEFVGMYAFAECWSLPAASFPLCQSVEIKMFYDCLSLSMAYFPELVSLSGAAFQACIRLESVNLDKCKKIDALAFSGCKALPSIDLPQCEDIGDGAFYGCLALSSISLPECIGIGGQAFNNCSLLKELDLPKCTVIGANAFKDNSATGLKLSSISLPECQSLSSGAFMYQWELSTISLPKATTIGSSCFNSCYNLVSLYILGSTYISLYDSNVFKSTPIGGYSTSAGQYGSIYVPSSLYSQYTTSYPWRTLSDRIVSVAI